MSWERRQIILAPQGVMCSTAMFLACLFLYSATSVVLADDELALDQVLTVASIQGLAVQESWGYGKPVDGIGKLVIDLEGRQMQLTSFNLMGEEKFNTGATIINQNFEIGEVEKVDPRKLVIRGKNEWGYPFIASLSTMDRGLDFLLVIEGRGRREIRNLNGAGLALKKKYAPGIKLGLGAD